MHSNLLRAGTAPRLALHFPSGNLSRDDAWDLKKPTASRSCSASPGNALPLCLERFWRASWHSPASGGSDCCSPGRYAWRIYFTPLLVWGKERQDSSHWKPTPSWEKGKNSFPLKSWFVLLAQLFIYIKHTGYVTVWGRKFLPWGFPVYDAIRKKFHLPLRMRKMNTYVFKPHNSHKFISNPPKCSPKYFHSNKEKTFPICSFSAS